MSASDVGRQEAFGGGVGGHPPRLRRGCPGWRPQPVLCCVSKLNICAGEAPRLETRGRTAQAMAWKSSSRNCLGGNPYQVYRRAHRPCLGRGVRHPYADELSSVQTPRMAERESRQTLEPDCNAARSPSTACGDAPSTALSRWSLEPGRATVLLSAGPLRGSVAAGRTPLRRTMGCNPDGDHHRNSQLGARPRIRSRREYDPHDGTAHGLATHIAASRRETTNRLSRSASVRHCQ